jgi:hypothetical protein
VVRGGSWNNNAENCRAAYRNRITPGRRRIRNENVRAFLRRLGWMRRAFQKNQLSPNDVQRRLMGWLGHAAQADSFSLVVRLASGWVFKKGRFKSFKAC